MFCTRPLRVTLNKLALSDCLRLALSCPCSPSTHRYRSFIVASKRTRDRNRGPVAWPKRALILFAVIFITVFGLVFFTGDKTATPKLGIDLQGGTRITLVPQGDRPSQDQLTQARTILENRVNGMGVSGAEVVTDGDNLVITVPGDDAGEARTLGRTSQLLFRAVAQPSPPTDKYQKTVTDMANKWVKNGVLTPDQANEKLKNVVPILKQLGVPNPPQELKVTAKAPQTPANSVEEQQQRDLQVQTLREDRQSTDPDVQSAAVALMTCSDNDPLAGADDPSKPLVACSDQGPMLLEPAPLLDGETDKVHGKRLTGSLIDTNSQITGGYDAKQAQMAITFRFKTGADTPGGETWYKFGNEMMGRQVAIVLDSRVISAPTIQGATPPGEVSQITGDFSQQEAEELANNLRYGALPISFVGENGEPGGTTTRISPSLGAASLKAGIIAGVVGVILVAAWALVYYRALGFVAMLSLIASFVLVFGSIVLLGRWIGYSLDLAGIAGLIIGLGTTADSFVIYFERIKDEIHNGASFRSAVPRAWKRAKSTIITGNFVSLFAAVILYFLAIGEVKGFAFTLGLTTVFDVIVAFLITAPLVILLSRRNFFRNTRVNGLGSAFRAQERQRLHQAAQTERGAVPAITKDDNSERKDDK
ncbi:protein translocase subunit SecD [Corynebacterium sp. 4HC-13]|uniref:Protein translocase subunit SecD n=1 Tax=Corynebacterium anserum TaxID=2684406 RepID=A0A7G7YNK3_9CORY|nr:protein translocase subunit SecD [Corynebacterium anserum]QNH96073.1 protein translocase subunit SecD [Corynebacterium anserum]